MDERAFLCYINAKDDFFNNTDINFDNEYFFRVEVDKSQLIYTYKLHVSKRRVTQPKGFWGKNISTVNVITGENGSGKTSLIRFITNNIGRGTTAMHGEGVIYIVSQNGLYIVFHNCQELSIEKTSDAAKIKIFTKKEYFETLRNKGNFNPPYDNKRFWKNIIFFSNYFGSIGIRRETGYLIDISKNNNICDVISEFESLEKLQSVTIQEAYRNFQNIKRFKYSLDDCFKTIAEKIISVPDLLLFELKYTIDIYGCFYNKEKFPNGKWIGKNRYDEINRYRTSDENERAFEFEAAINKFSVDLLWYLLEKQVIGEALLNTYINELAETKEETGVTIAIRCLQSCVNEEIEKWIKVLEFLEKKEKCYILYWQNSKVFVYKWDMADAELVKHLISSNKAEQFFECKLVGSGTNGHYSSGEESRVNFLVSLFDALAKVKESKGETDNNNIILLLDEVDAYYHPQLQVNLVSEILEMVSKVFEDFYVQIILTSNTPLELSDFPSANIIYLENGGVNTNQNEINTFGSNVCSLLKNNFYIDSAMGTFARNKINKAIEFLNRENVQEIDKGCVQYLISIIGEPIVKNKLEQMYYERFPEEIPNKDEEIASYKEQIEKLRMRIVEGQSIDTKMLEQLEEELYKLTSIIKEIKG